MKSFAEIYRDVYSWSVSNFGEQVSKVYNVPCKALFPLIGLQEEVGELSRATNMVERLDALGDQMVYLFDFLNRDAFPQSDLEACLALSSQGEAKYTLQGSLGLLSHAVLKRHQGIRKFTNIDHYKEKRKEAVIHLLKSIRQQLPSTISLRACLYVTWEGVQKRDWKENPGTSHLDTEVTSDKMKLMEYLTQDNSP